MSQKGGGEAAAGQPSEDSIRAAIQTLSAMVSPPLPAGARPLRCCRGAPIGRPPPKTRCTRGRTAAPCPSAHIALLCAQIMRPLERATHFCKQPHRLLQTATRQKPQPRLSSTPRPGRDLGRHGQGRAARSAQGPGGGRGRGGGCLPACFNRARRAATARRDDGALPPRLRAFPPRLSHPARACTAAAQCHVSPNCVPSPPSTCNLR